MKILLKGELKQENIKNCIGKIETSLICIDGKKIPTEYSALIISDEDETPRYIVPIGGDIS